MRIAYIATRGISAAGAGGANVPSSSNGARTRVNDRMDVKPHEKRCGTRIESSAPGAFHSAGGVDKRKGWGIRSLPADREAQAQPVLEVRRLDRHRAGAQLLRHPVLLQEPDAAVEAPLAEEQVHPRAGRPAERGL